MANTDYPATQSQVDSVVDALFARAASGFLRSAITQQEGLFLRRLASRAHVRKTIEVGCANGVSALYICSGIAQKENPSHTAIDPFQSSEFEGRGAMNVQRAGFQFFRLIEDFSEVALPSLLRDGERFDLALIDGLHTADQTLIDFFYLDRLLNDGGVIVFDDVNATAVNKIVRYISTYPNYTLIGTSGRRGVQRRIVNVVKYGLSILLWPIRKILGEAVCREFFDVSLIHPEHLWTIDSCTMAAFQKTGSADRDTDWYRGI